MDAPPIQYARTGDGVNVAYWAKGPQARRDAGPPFRPRCPPPPADPPRTHGNPRTLADNWGEQTLAASGVCAGRRRAVNAPPAPGRQQPGRVIKEEERSRGVVLLREWQRGRVAWTNEAGGHVRTHLQIQQVVEISLPRICDRCAQCRETTRGLLPLPL